MKPARPTSIRVSEPTAQSEHIDELIFDGLVARDAAFHFTPALAESWDRPDPLTIVFHLRKDVRFHDGRPLTARDVVWTINSMRDGTVISAKAATYASVANVEARDDHTVDLSSEEAGQFSADESFHRRDGHCAGRAAAASSGGIRSGRGRFVS